MQAVFCTLLAAALIVGPAQSLRCYTCTRVSTNAACDTVVKCPPSLESFCHKTDAALSMGPIVTKGCVATCKEGSVNAEAITGTISCCSTDLCNGATATRTSYGMLTLALGVSILLLRTRF